MERFLYIGVGGFIGSVCRYGLSSMLYRVLGDRFPYGTLAVNIIGCFTIGFLMTLFETRFLVQPYLRLFITIGILGGFTTFSTFSYETIEILKGGNITLGVLNILGSVLLCLVATWLGSVSGKLF